MQIEWEIWVYYAKSMGEWKKVGEYFRNNAIQIQVIGVAFECEFSNT